MNFAVSVVIPNYNGQRLLEKYLPSVQSTMRSGDQLLIVDDASSDDSLGWLQKRFQVEGFIQRPGFRVGSGEWKDGHKKGEVLVVANDLNQRYAASCNRGVQLARHPYIFLLNSDVKTHPKTLPQLVSHFTDPSVFAVGCIEQEPQADGPALLGGKNILPFVRGRFIHARASEFASGETAWVSGGSGMFDRAKWLELAGFDDNFRPAYWEDIDLSARARQRGWKVLFDAEAKVEHRHETTNTSAFGQTKIEQMSWRNGTAFLKKHASPKQRLLSWLWLPYWYLKAPKMYWFCWSLLVITILAAALRLNQLGEVPHGMTWDEAAIGYNGYAIFTTRRDEWLNKLPVSFRSFGDYKAPLAIYLNGPFSYFLGMQLWAVRLPFALFGIAAVVAMGLLMRELIWWRDGKKFLDRWPVAELAGLAAAMMLAISPWHLHFSRTGFESGMALSLLLWGEYFLLRLSRPGQVRASAGWQHFSEAVLLAASVLSMVGSIYAYHSAKVVVPGMLVMLTAMAFLSRQKRLMYPVMTYFVIFSTLMIPLLKDTIWGSGGARFTQSSVFGQFGLVPGLGLLVENFARHLDPRFVMAGLTPTLRHGDGNWGVLYATDIGLVLAGLVSVFWPQTRRSRSVVLLALAWCVLGILPAAIGVDVPHANRALLALPGFIFLAVLGGEWLWFNLRKLPLSKSWLGSKQETNLLAKSVLGTLVLVNFLLFFAYQRDYYTLFAARSTTDWSDGYLSAFRIAKEYEPRVNNILVSNRYGQAYIYALFVRRTNPINYQSGSLAKYLFVDTISEADRARQNTLIIATPDQLGPQPGDKLVYGANGTIRFIVVPPTQLDTTPARQP